MAEQMSRSWRITVKTGSKISGFPMIVEFECDRSAAYQAAVKQFGEDRVLGISL